MKKVLLIENYGADFFRNRVSFAKYLIAHGYDVFALVPNDEYSRKIEKEGINVLTYNFNRKNKGIFQLFLLIRSYHKIIKEYNFDIIHSFRFQPNLANVISNFFNKRRIVLHVTGLGIAYSNNGIKFKTYRLISQFIYMVKLFRGTKIIVQNFEDAKTFWFYGCTNKIVLIKGSGVNTDLFFRQTLVDPIIRSKNDEFVFICVTRLIWEKGIKELVDAFTYINNIKVKLWIVGWIDEENPRKISNSYIESFKENPIIHFLGERTDIKELLEAADVFIYPTYYREGIPRGILEAMSMCMPIITTDTPGCNLTIKNNENGKLIEPASSIAIVKAVNEILEEGDIESMGIKSRKLVLESFSDKKVFKQILNVYNSI
jgi:glycosyltransferase involved in cell wall biosynthesis